MAMMPQLGYQNMGSMYGMMPPNPVPRNTVIMSGMNMFGGSMNGSQAGGVPPSLPPWWRFTTTADVKFFNGDFC